MYVIHTHILRYVEGIAELRECLFGNEVYQYEIYDGKKIMLFIRGYIKLKFFHVNKMKLLCLYYVYLYTF